MPSAQTFSILRRGNIRQQHDVGETARRERADPGRQPHVPGRVDRRRIGSRSRAQARSRSQCARYDRMAPSSSVCEALRSSVVKAICDQSARPLPSRNEDLRPWRRTKLHEDAARQLLPGLLRRRTSWSEARPAAAKALIEPSRAGPSHAPRPRRALEGRLDHAPQPLIGRVFRVPHRRPVHHLVEARRPSGFGQESSLLVVAEPAAAPSHRRSAARPSPAVGKS